MSSGPEVQGTWSLLTGENTYASQTSQDPHTSRKVQSWIPSDDGMLHRELPQPHYLESQLSGPPVSLFNYNRNDNQGNIQRFYFAAARTDFATGTKTCNLYVQNGTTWIIVSTVGVLSDAPMFKTIGNNLHMLDGVANWLFDGTTWVIDGLRVPNITPLQTATPGQTVGITPPSGSVGPSLPTTAQQVGAGSQWQTIQNIEAIGTASANVFLSNGATSTLLQGRGYGSSIPAGATIAGIVLTTQRHTASGIVIDSNIQLLKAGTAVGTNKATATHWPTSPGFATYGGPSDLWGTTWTPADINNPNFGAQLAASRTSGGDTVFVNFLQITVYYAPAGVQMAYPPLTIAASPTGLVQDPVTKIVTITTTTTSALAFQPGDEIVIAGATNSSYNGTFTVAGTFFTGGVYVITAFNPAGPLAASGGGTVAVRDVLVITTANHGFVAGETVMASGITDATYNGTWVISLVISPTSFFMRVNFVGEAASGNGTVSPATNTSALQEYFPAIDTTATGILTCLVERNYWYTNADETAGRGHESSSSASNPISSGPLTNKKVAVYQTPGLFSCSTGSTTVNITPSTDNPGPTLPSIQPDRVGLTVWIDGNRIGTIATVVSPTQLTLTATAPTSISNGRALILDDKCTHWHIYASEADGSKVGQFLMTIPVTQNLTTTPVYDQSPFIDDSANRFLPIFRPVRNDPPPPSKILEAHKYRLWRVRATRPNFFDFTANEEVTSGGNGDATQSVPGADVNTVSDIVNEVSFPDQSNRIRGLISHADALYMFSERQCYPLYGESIDDFALSQVNAFNVGIAGRFAGKSTIYGMALMSYDRKVFLYPSSGIPTTADATSVLVEIGKPKRNTFEQIDTTRLDEVVSEFYFFGRRNWLIFAFQMKGN